MSLAKKTQPQKGFSKPNVSNIFDVRLSRFRQKTEHFSVNKNVQQDVDVQSKPKNLLRGFIITDVMALIVSLAGSWLLAMAVNTILFGRHTLNSATDTSVTLMAQFVLVGLGIILWFGHTNHYRVRMPFWMATRKIIETICFALLIGCFLQFVAKNDFSRLWLVSSWIFSIFSIIVFRALWRANLRKKGLWQIKTLIIGDGTTAERAEAALQSDMSLGYSPIAKIKELPWALRDMGHSWKSLCQEHGVDHVLIALDNEEFTNAQQSLAQLMRERISFSVCPSLHNLSVAGMVQQYFLGHDVMFLTRSGGLDCSLACFLKRSFDVVCSGMALLLLSPILVLVASIVKLDGGGSNVSP
jgi:undecaprenyl-phosphate galactose phosphotransferase